MAAEGDIATRAGAAANAAAGERVGRVRVTDGLASAILDISGLNPATATALEANVRRALEGTPGVDAVRIVRTAEQAPGTPPAAEAPAARPRMILAVASGKGGVGKSTVAANLAFALARAGHKTGLLDADIHGPSVPTILGMAGTRAEARDEKLQPVRAYGIAALSMGFLADPDRAVAWRGPMASSAMAQMIERADWSGTDILVIDMPPGTGDITLTLAQKVKPDAVIIVSTPQDLALIDAKRALALFRQLDVPVLGVIENMSVFTCPKCGERSAIFGEGGAAAAAEAAGLPLLARLPLDMAYRDASDAGRPAPAEPFDALAIAVLEAMKELA